MRFYSEFNVKSIVKRTGLSQSEEKDRSETETELMVENDKKKLLKRLWEKKIPGDEGRIEIRIRNDRLIFVFDD